MQSVLEIRTNNCYLFFKKDMLNLDKLGAQGNYGAANMSRVWKGQQAKISEKQPNVPNRNLVKISRELKNYQVESLYALFEQSLKRLCPTR